MSKVCVFAGTADGRELVEYLLAQGVLVTACVATEYGESLLRPRPGLTISAGRLERGEMEAMFQAEQFDCVVDATHPYAAAVTENIFAACERTGVDCLRLLRAGGEVPCEAIFVEDTAAAVRYLQSVEGNILLTTGSKEIAAYTAVPDFEHRVFARVLPLESSIAACRGCGLPAANILAMQGPFTEEMNVAMLHAVNAAIMVTKDSGGKGGFAEKAAAAKAAGIPLLVIGRPEQKNGLGYAETVAALCEKLQIQPRTHVSIVGIGPGDRDTMTIGARDAIAKADCLIGAGRMLDAVAAPHQMRCEAIAPEKIVEAIRSHAEWRKVCVVMSGDVGFYSGAKKLLPLLTQETVKVYPGISSMVCLCARLGTSYEDVRPYSLHGREGDIIPVVSANCRVFTLVGGEDGMKKLCQSLVDGGYGEARVSVGENLGYPEEKITVGTAQELCDRSFDRLAAALIEHDAKTIVTHGLPDAAFLRGVHADGAVVPMTKSEIRSIALSKLQLTKDAVCWDIGAGTGSVSIEMALQAHTGAVYAVEKKPDAIALLQENKARFHANHLHIVSGTAPEACAGLPAPSHVFIGGSSGNLREIMALCRKKNPNCTIVATAIALETVAELGALMKEYPRSEVCCVSVAQGKAAGPYHLMTAQNPVYIFTFRAQECGA